MRQKTAPAKSPEEEYVEAAILHQQLLKMGNPKGSNAAHDRLIRAMRQIRNRPDRGRSFLLENLKHSDENVRLWSAFHLLPLEEKVALAELIKLSTSAKDLRVQASAEVTLEEWEKGALDVDWFMKE